MKRMLIILLFVSTLAACAPTPAPPGELAIAAISPRPTLAPDTATATAEPTPTVGYQATAEFAQQTADAASRQLVDATVTHEAIAFVQQGWTATADERQAISAIQTATARRTAVPMTQTQDARFFAAHGTDAALVGTAIVMTLNAPTQLVAMAQARADAQYAAFNELAQGIGLLALALFLLVATIWMARALLARTPTAKAPAQQATPPPTPAATYQRSQGTVVTVRRLQDDGFHSLATSLVPCTAEQLTELAERVLRRHVSLAVNNFEGGGTLWTRATFYAMRSWMRAQRYVKSIPPAGMVALTDDGEAFLLAWLDHKRLPRGAEFSPESCENPMSMSHDHENHGHESGRGVVFSPISTAEMDIDA